MKLPTAARIAIYLVGPLLAPVLVLLVCARDDGSIFYRAASAIFIGHAPQPGDGAFQYPLGWLLMLTCGFALGIAMSVTAHFAWLREKA